LPIEALSGGNQQKVVVGRWLATNRRLLIAEDPTAGVDVGAKAEIYAQLRSLTAIGLGVLVASSELPELIGLCDRIIVMSQGRTIAEFGPGASEEEIRHASANRTEAA
jgi:ribose transport system ATP-binding protein